MLSFVKVPHVRASAVVQRKDMPGSLLRWPQPGCATSHWSRAAHGVHYIPLLVLTQAYSLLSPSVLHRPLMSVLRQRLLVSLFPHDTAAVAALDCPCSWAFNNGIGAAQCSALRGEPTVSRYKQESPHAIPGVLPLD